MKSKFMDQWNQDWRNKTREDTHTHTKAMIPSVSQHINPVFHYLTRDEMRIIGRLLIGHTRLAAHMYRLRIEKSPICPECKSCEETVEHYLIDCLAFAQARLDLKREIHRVTGIFHEKLNMRMLLTGHPHTSLTHKKKILKATVRFVRDTKEEVW